MVFQPGNFDSRHFNPWPAYEMSVHDHVDTPCHVSTTNHVDTKDHVSTRPVIKSKMRSNGKPFVLASKKIKF